jgi:glutathione S-transferase
VFATVAGAVERPICAEQAHSFPTCEEDDAMTTFRLLHLHTSPFSERVRWVLDLKRIAYEREPYSIAEGEPHLAEETGQRQVPVLFVDGQPHPDSTAIVDWLEAFAPEPRLLPESPAEAAEVRLYEELANAVIAPEGRQLVIGRMLAMKNDRVIAAGRYFAAKYGHSAFAEQRARAAVVRALEILAARVSVRPFLVADRFTRADLTVAAALLDVVPPDESLFVCDPPFMRALMTDPALAADARFAAVLAYCDRIYREHRGGVVAPTRPTRV